MKTTRRRVLQGGAALLAMPSIPAGADDVAGQTLWYDKPASAWTEALPLGNGRLGAMVFGGVAQERIQINEATLWGGGPHDYVNPQAAANLAPLRQAIFAGQVQEAERLTTQMMGNPSLLMPYQPFCDLRLAFEGAADAADYRRDLSLDQAVAGVAYMAGGARMRREIFISHPAQVMVVRLTADRP